jgi:uncharacterized protein YggL (DUF469 family)
MDLNQAIKETKEHLELNGGGDDDGFVSNDDVIQHLMDECGRTGDGGCTMAGSEFCDWECPFS